MTDIAQVLPAPAVAPAAKSKPVEFLQDADGNLSSTRLAFLIWAIGVLAVWIILSIKSSTMVPIPNEVIAVLGVLMTGKVVQKFGE